MHRILGPVLAVMLWIIPAAVWAKDQAKSAQSIVNSSTVWTNQAGSTAQFMFTLSATQPGVYAVSGAYHNNNVNFGCRQAPYPLTGVYYEASQVLSFTVAWSNGVENCFSVTGWTGFFDLNASPMTLQTNWNLSFLASTGAHQILTGQNIFERTK